jgi:hypothetical protein
MPDFEKLEATYAYTVEHKDTWDQMVWAYPIFADEKETNICGTGCCFAGNALLVEGYRFEWVKVTEWGWQLHIVDPTGSRKYDRDFISSLAAEVLDLDDADETRVFHPTNTLADLRNIIDKWRYRPR